MLRNLFKLIQNMLNSYFYKVTRLGGGLVTKSCPTLGTCQGCQAPLSMGFSRQEYWSGLQFPSLGDLPNPGIKHGSPALQADSLLAELPRKPCDPIELLNLLSPVLSTSTILAPTFMMLLRFSSLTEMNIGLM